MALSPVARAAVRSARALASSSGRSTPPPTPTRSSISTTRAYSGGFSTMWRANSSGRLCQPIFSASPKPLVMASRVGSPLRSSRALVATVVPIRTASTRPGSSGPEAGPVAAPSIRRMPSTAASA